MTRESAREKAKRLLGEGRVIVVSVEPGLVNASVRSEGAIYATGWRHGTWFCDCENASHTAVASCSHVRALHLICAPDLETSHD